MLGKAFQGKKTYFCVWREWGVVQNDNSSVKFESKEVHMNNPLIIPYNSLIEYIIS